MFILTYFLKVKRLRQVEWKIGLGNIHCDTTAGVNDAHLKEKHISWSVHGQIQPTSLKLTHFTKDLDF